MIVDVELEEWPDSAVVRRVRPGYARVPAAAHRDAAAGLTDRQAVFYRNLIRIARRIRGGTIPVDFELPSGERLYLDRGCVRIAELAGFIRPLRDDEDGVVSVVELAWTV